LWVAVILVSIAAFIAIVLSVPLDLEFRIEVPGKPKFTARLVWLFGLVKKELKRGKKKEDKKPVNRIEQARAILDILRTKGLLKRLRCLFKGILSRIKLREFRIDLKVGLDDPSNTGLILAIIGPPAFLANSFLPVQINVQPSFDKATLEGNVYVRARLRPIRLVIPLLRFAFSKPAMRVVKKWIVRKWKRKK